MPSDIDSISRLGIIARRYPLMLRDFGLRKLTDRLVCLFPNGYPCFQLKVSLVERKEAKYSLIWYKNYYHFKPVAWVCKPWFFNVYDRWDQGDLLWLFFVVLFRYCSLCDYSFLNESQFVFLSFLIPGRNLVRAGGIVTNMRLRRFHALTLPFPWLGNC